MPTLRRSARLQEKAFRARPKLLKLPLELRRLIWNHLLDSTVVVYGDDEKADDQRKAVEARRRALAILQVCRQTYEDIGTSWIGRVSFYFESPDAFLKALPLEHSTTISQIRRIRMRASKPGKENLPNSDYQTFWQQDADEIEPGQRNHRWISWPEALHRRPSLQLDMLMVEGVPDSTFRNEASVANSIEFGNGWRELRLYTENSDKTDMPNS